MNITTNILYRTFFIKAEEYGTAFTVTVDDQEYLITAKHLLDESKKSFPIKIFFKEKWLELNGVVVGHGRGEIDISVLTVNIRLSGDHHKVDPTSAGLSLGQEVCFLGFPYKMWGNVGDKMQGRPCPFVKKGVLSSLSVEVPEIFYVDAINNEGFSGGPLVFSERSNPNKLKIAGVVSKFKLEFEPVINEIGERTANTVAYNTGFLLAYGIKHAIDIIKFARST